VGRADLGPVDQPFGAQEPDREKKDVDALLLLDRRLVAREAPPACRGQRDAVARDAGGERGGLGLSMNGINQDGAFGNIGSLYYQGVQYGYNFQIARGLPLTVYAGFDTLKYNTGFGAPIAPFDTMSGTLPGYGAHAGIEFKPTSNVSLSLGFGYTQQ